MGEFAYKAKDRAGRIRTGKVDAPNKAVAKELLIKMRFRPLKIVAVSAAGTAEGGFFSKFIFRDDKGNLQIAFSSLAPSQKELIVFTKQFATMIGSGVPLITALSVLAPQQRNRNFAKTINRLRFSVENGSTLSDAMTASPDTFNTLYTSLVKAGESSGSLDTILKRISEYIEKAAKIRSQVKKAMMYPIFVLVVSIAVLAGLMLFVVPKLGEQFTQSGKELPAITQLVIDLSKNIQDNWYVYFGIPLLIPIIIFFARRTEGGLRNTDALLLKFPGLGTLLRKVTVGRFCQTMATMLSAGVPILEGLSICASSAGNKVIEEFVLNVRTKISEGKTFAEPLGEGGLFPAMVVSMVKVGEATGALDDMLQKVSEFYEQEVEEAVAAMISLIEPAMIVGIGGMVGFIVIAMYMPIFDMASTVGG